MSDSEETTSTATATTSTVSTTTTTSTAPVQLTTTTTTAASPAQAIFPMQGIHPPGHLDVKGNIADNWKSFKQQWSNYAVITNIHQQPEAYKVALFLHCIGPEALKIFNGMSFDNAQEREQLATIIKKFDEFTIGETNETYERYVFNSRNQSPEETIDAHVATLRTLAQTCNFCECLRDSLIRDRIVLGIFNPQTRKRLLQERKLTLNKCIDICRSTETTASQMKAISGDKAPEDVNRIDEKQEKTRPPVTSEETANMIRMTRATSPENLVSSVVEFTRSKKKNVLPGDINAVSVGEEITLQTNARNLQSALTRYSRQIVPHHQQTKTKMSTT